MRFDSSTPTLRSFVRISFHFAIPAPLQTQLAEWLVCIARKWPNVSSNPPIRVGTSLSVVKVMQTKLPEHERAFVLTLLAGELLQCTVQTRQRRLFGVDTPSCFYSPIREASKNRLMCADTSLNCCQTLRSHTQIHRPATYFEWWREGHDDSQQRLQECIFGSCQRVSPLCHAILGFLLPTDVSSKSHFLL